MAALSAIINAIVERLTVFHVEQWLVIKPTFWSQAPAPCLARCPVFVGNGSANEAAKLKDTRLQNPRFDC